MYLGEANDVVIIFVTINIIREANKQRKKRKNCFNAAVMQCF